MLWRCGTVCPCHLNLMLMLLRAKSTNSNMYVLCACGTHVNFNITKWYGCHNRIYARDVRDVWRACARDWCHRLRKESTKKLSSILFCHSFEIDSVLVENRQIKTFGMASVFHSYHIQHQYNRKCANTCKKWDLHWNCQKHSNHSKFVMLVCPVTAIVELEWTRLGALYPFPFKWEQAHTYTAMPIAHTHTHTQTQRWFERVIRIRGEYVIDFTVHRVHSFSMSLTVNGRTNENGSRPFSLSWSFCQVQFLCQLLFKLDNWIGEIGKLLKTTIGEREIFTWKLSVFKENNKTKP